MPLHKACGTSLLRVAAALAKAMSVGGVDASIHRVDRFAAGGQPADSRL